MKTIIQQLALLSVFIFTLHAADTITLPVDSPAFVFSPGNWSGDAGRGGKLFRQTWNPGAYFRVTWETKSATPSAKILLDTSTYTEKFKAPMMAYCIDGVWKSMIPCSTEILVTELNSSGKHELTGLLYSEEQMERWGSPGTSGLNVFRVKGLELDAGSTPIPSSPKGKWALLIGDSITEGCGLGALPDYSHLLGEALQTVGFEYGVSACGWSGWIHKGDNTGDVPAYYSLSKPGNSYNDAASRWNKIDGNGHSLLDTQGHLSAYGETGQEPALIFINYGTNDRNFKADLTETVTQGLSALRQSAPNAQIVLLIPFGQYCAEEIRAAVDAHKKNHPEDVKIAILDLGTAEAKNLNAKGGLMGGLHPNALGHARFAAQLIPQIISILNSTSK